MANKTRDLGSLSGVGAGQWINLAQGPVNLQATLRNGATAAQVAFEFSVDQVGAIPGVTVTLSNTTPSDGIALDQELSWPYGRMRAISVTGGSVSGSATVKE